MRIRTNLFEDMFRMQEEFFGGAAGAHFAYPQRRRQNAGAEMLPYRRAMTDVEVTDKEYIANIELPGVDKKDIKINITNDEIEVSVGKKEEIEQEDKKTGDYCYKRSYAGFKRCFSLPEGTNIDTIDASYINGVLSLKIPKKELPPTKTRLLEVK